MQTRDYVYVQDAVESVMIALGRHVNGIYNVGTGEETTVNDIFHRLKVITRAKVKNCTVQGKRANNYEVSWIAQSLQKNRLGADDFLLLKDSLKPWNFSRKNGNFFV